MQTNIEKEEVTSLLEEDEVLRLVKIIDEICDQAIDAGEGKTSRQIADLAYAEIDPLGTAPDIVEGLARLALLQIVEHWKRQQEKRKAN